MKLLLKPRFISTLLIVLFVGFSFAACHHNTGNNKDYTPTPKPTSPLAIKLVDSTCHFISKRDIESYIEHYQQFKKSRDTSFGKVEDNMLSVPTSFNSYIVKAILADENCIGLRILHGMGPDNRLHVILVGIDTSYSTLYIKRPDEKCHTAQVMKSKRSTAPQAESTQAQTAQANEQSANGEIGGAEMGQMP